MRPTTRRGLGAAYREGGVDRVVLLCWVPGGVPTAVAAEALACILAPPPSAGGQRTQRVLPHAAAAHGLSATCPSGHSRRLRRRPSSLIFSRNLPTRSCRTFLSQPRCLYPSLLPSHFSVCTLRHPLLPHNLMHLRYKAVTLRSHENPGQRGAGETHLQAG